MAFELPLHIGLVYMRWYALGIVVAVAASAVALIRARRKQRPPELGAVSDEWIAQHRSELPHQ